MRDFFDFTQSPNREINGKLLADRVAFADLFELYERISEHPEVQGNLERFYNEIVSGELFQSPVNVSGDVRRKLAWYVTEFVTQRLLQGRTHRAYSRFGESVSRRDVILTFNWDWLADEALVEQWEELDYGFPESEIATDRFSRKNFFGGRRLLKLHGSMNWRQCESGRHFAFETSFSSVPLRRRACERHGCRDFADPVIVPPVWTKNEYTWQLARLWEKAYRALSTADEVVVAGYSLPAFDLYASGLFRQSLGMANRSARVIAITPDRSAVARLSRAARRKVEVPCERFELYFA